MEFPNDEMFNCWLGGFFEADGCIKMTKTFSVAVNISQVDPKALFEIKKRFGGSIDYHMPYIKYNQVKTWYQYQCGNRNNILKLLLAIVPYLISKKQTAQYIIEYIQKYPNQRDCSDKEYKQELYDFIKNEKTKCVLMEDLPDDNQFDIRGVYQPRKKSE